MAAQLFYVPFDPIFTSRGLFAGAARAYFYLSGTTTLAPIYADASLAVPLPNPVVADALGQLPAIYLDDTKTYRLRLTDRLGVQIGDDYDPYVPGKERLGPPGPADNTYATLVAFKASDINRKTASLVGVPGVSDGRFNWTLGNYAGQADDRDIIKADSTPLSTGAWVRQGITSIAGLNKALNPIDVFLVGGQSNAAAGFGGNPALAPTPEPGSSYYFAAKPNENGPMLEQKDEAAFWGAFDQAYYAATGRKVMLVTAAVGGSSQQAVSDSGAGNWSPTGALRGNAVTKVQAAMSAASAAGFNPVFRGVLWSQGEADGGAINAGTTTFTDYKTALVQMIAYFRTQFGARMPFYISITGTAGNEADSPGYDQIRTVQRQVANEDPYTHIAFGNALSFQTRSGYIEADKVHYSQAGKNEMGAVLAANVVGAQARLAFQFVDGLLRDLFFGGRAFVGGTQGTAQIDALNGQISDVPALMMGADQGKSTRTDNVRKLGAFCAPNYDTDLFPWMLMGIDAQAGTNVVNWGGGFGGFGHATSHNFYTAAAPGNGAGNRRMTLSEQGVNFAGLPTSASGLTSGQVWVDTAAGNALKIVS